MAYHLSRFILKVFCLLFFRVQGHNAMNIPPSGGYLLVSNHASNLDPLLLGVACVRRLAFLAKAELFRVPLLGQWCWAVGAHPIQRGKGDRKAMMESIRLVRDEGEILVAFPEGTRTSDGNLQDGKPGVAMIAAQAGAPCIPAYIDGSFQAWPRGRVLFRPVKIHVWYGEPFSLPERQEGMATRDYYQICADEMVRHIAALRETALEYRMKRVR
jgi:1-acyl-sn-glycerol-3-phosphate acyltransferase